MYELYGIECTVYVDHLLKAFITGYNMINNIAHYNVRYLVGNYVEKMFDMIELLLTM